MMDEVLCFKKCRMCGQEWATRDDFIDDPKLEIIGYQPFLNQPDNGLLLFHHKLPHCNTSLAMKATLFRSLYDGPVYGKSYHGTPECHGKCNHIEDLTACNMHCANAFVREIIQILQARHRRIVGL